MNERTLAQRLDRLERETRRLKLTGIGILMAITAVVLMGQAMAKQETKVIEAERFILKDAEGRDRGGLQVMADGRPILRLADEKGWPRAELVVLSNDTPALYFYDYQKGRDVGRRYLAWLGVSRHGSVTLALVDREEQSEAQLSVPGPRLHFIDKDGRVVWSAP